MRMCPKIEDASVQTDTGKSGRHSLLLFSKKWGEAASNVDKTEKTIFVLSVFVLSMDKSFPHLHQ